MDQVNPWEFFPGSQYTWISFVMDTKSCGIQGLMAKTISTHSNHLKTHLSEKTSFKSKSNAHHGH